MKYRILDLYSVKDFLLSIKEIKEFFGEDELQSDEIGDGNVNFVYIVKSKKDPKKALIVKQAVPYLRCAGEEFALSRERMTFEIRALQNYAKIVSKYVPKIYFSDEEMSIVVMEYLSNHIIMRKGLIEGGIYNDFSEHISDFLASSLFYTSSLYLQSDQKRLLMDRFNQNRELCKLTEDFVFTFAYMDHESNFIDKNCELEAKELFERMDFRKNLLELKYLFMTKSDALLHGDLHTGSIMLNEKETFVIDPEFAFFGPFGFDIGALVANLFNSYISHMFNEGNDEYREWILQTVSQIYEKFETKFLNLWNGVDSSALITKGFIEDDALDEYKKEFMDSIFKESVGFCGAKMARRVFGIAGVEEIRGIKDDMKRKKAALKALEVGLFLIKEYKNIKTPTELTEVIRSMS